MPSPADQIPQVLREAVIAAEDSRFRQHRGVDPLATVRAAFRDLTGGRTQGGSTLTQQYVKNVYVGDDRTLLRKVREAALAFPGKIAVGIDARGGRVATRGWAEETDVMAVDLARQFEDAGVAGLHIEDQVNPKRCGHLDGKDVVDTTTAVRRIRAAVSARRDPDLVIMARTDVRGVAGLDAAIERAKALQDAGADSIFAEAMSSLDEFAAMRAAVDVPILANMTEFGKSELFTTSQLRDVGVNIVIYPVSLLRLAMGAAERGLDAILEEGTLASKVPEMQTRARLYELLDYAGYSAFDEDVFTFTLEGNRGGA